MLRVSECCLGVWGDRIEFEGEAGDSLSLVSSPLLPHASSPHLQRHSSVRPHARKEGRNRARWRQETQTQSPQASWGCRSARCSSFCLCFGWHDEVAVAVAGEGEAVKSARAIGISSQQYNNNTGLLWMQPGPAVPHFSVRPLAVTTGRDASACGCEARKGRVSGVVVARWKTTGYPFFESVEKDCEARGGSQQSNAGWERTEMVEKCGVARDVPRPGQIEPATPKREEHAGARSLLFLLVHSQPTKYTTPVTYLPTLHQPKFRRPRTGWLLRSPISARLTSARGKSRGHASHLPRQSTDH